MGSDKLQARSAAERAVPIALVHLVWAPLGPSALAGFLDSYRSRPAGVEHDLVILFNGFDGARDMAAHRALLEGVDHRELTLGAPVQDLAAYAQAAQRLEHRQLFFANSHTRVLAGDWLAPLARWAGRPDVGLVGATGTFESHLEGAARGGEPTQSLLWLRRKLAVRKLRSRFPSFPNPHLRSNAFMGDRELLLELGLGRALDKDAAHRLESGWHNITRQVLAMGRSVLVVGRDGHAYEPQQWPASRTFRSGEQENLLIADNRTEEYRLASPDGRGTLSELAWGRASPHGRVVRSDDAP
jgi:hypothetical protein